MNLLPIKAESNDVVKDMVKLARFMSTHNTKWSGFKISLSEEHMEKTLQDIGCYVTTQFGNIAPADKVSYYFL
jgi:hypothetical protein